jgi:hypothetical protein
MLIQRALRTLLGICACVRIVGVHCERGGAYLNELEIGDSLEISVEQRYLLHFEPIDSVWTVDIYMIADIVRMFDKEEDAGAQELLCCD